MCNNYLATADHSLVMHHSTLVMHNSSLVLHCSYLVQDRGYLVMGHNYLAVVRCYLPPDGPYLVFEAYLLVLSMRNRQYFDLLNTLSKFTQYIE